jgi:hypothetical protein
VLEYAKLGLKGPSRMLSGLAPDEVKALRDGTNVDLMRRAKAAEQEAAEAQKALVADHAARLNDLEVGLHDGTKTRADIVEARNQGWLTDYDQIKKVEGVAEAREKQEGDGVAFADAWNGKRTLNPFEKADRDVADAGVDVLMKRDPERFNEVTAGTAVFEKTGILPKRTANAMRGAIASNDPERIQAAGNFASNMLTRNPNAFSGVEGGSELEKLGVQFDHYTNDLGFPADEAAKRIARENDPEYKRKIKVTDPEAKAFSDDLRKKAVSDLQGATFFGSGRFGSNKIGVAPEQRDEAALTYSELATDYYRENGDPAMAKKFALAQMNKMYGISNGALMKFPPEKAYPPVGESHEYVYAQAQADIKAATGKDIDPKNIYLMPIKTRTAEAFRNGQMPPYSVHYVEEVDGFKVQHQIDGKAFMADPNKARQAATAEREAKFNAERAAMPQTPTAPQMTADQMPSRSLLGSKTYTPAERQDNADATTADMQATIDAKKAEMQQAKDFATRGTNDQKRAEAIAKSRKEDAKRAAEDDSVLGNWIKSTPKNPLKGFVPGSPRKNRLPE